MGKVGTDDHYKGRDGMEPHELPREVGFLRAEVNRLRVKLGVYEENAEEPEMTLAEFMDRVPADLRERVARRLFTPPDVAGTVIVTAGGGKLSFDEVATRLDTAAAALNASPTGEPEPGTTGGGLSFDEVSAEVRARGEAMAIADVAAKWRAAVIDSAELKAEGEDEGAYHAKRSEANILLDRLNYKLDEVRGAEPVSLSPRFIVAELSITYVHSEDVEAVRARVEKPMGTIAKRFEHAVSVNEARGYRLRDWRFTSVPILSASAVSSVAATIAITETIVATFELEQ